METKLQRWRHGLVMVVYESGSEVKKSMFPRKIAREKGEGCQMQLLVASFFRAGKCFSHLLAWRQPCQ